MARLRHEWAFSAEIEFYAVVLLRAARAMNVYDVYQPVKDSLSAVVFSSGETLSDSISVGRMTPGQP